MTETQKKNAELLYEIVMALGEMRWKIDGECTTIGTVKSLVERWNRSEMALRELERISTSAVACRTSGCEEATAISRARVLLQTPFAPWENVNLGDGSNVKVSHPDRVNDELKTND